MSENNSVVKIAIISIVSLLIAAAITFYFLKPYLIKTQLPKPVIINTQDQPTLGNSKAKIHFVVFEDLKCINCARFNMNIFPYIKKHFIDTNIAKYTLMNVAFIEDSMPAANAARCVYTQKNALFFDYVDYIFQHQPAENENWATVPKLLNFANQIKGINIDQLAQCIIKSPYDSVINANLAQAKNLMGGRVATPTLYVNGIIVSPLTKSRIAKIVEEIR